MKFKDIKVGDEVYDIINISMGVWSNSYKSFFIKRQVTKVTPKQFEVKGRDCKFRKEDGTAVGGKGDLYLDGETYTGWRYNVTGTVKDQTEDAIRFKDLVSKYTSLSIMIRDLNLTAIQLEDNRHLINSVYDCLKLLKGE